MHTRLFLVIYFLGFITFVSHAQNFTVNTQNDSPDANISDGICDDGTGNCSLRAAVMESNSLGGAHEISLPDGQYVLTISGRGEDGSATGDIDINSDISLIGSSAFGTVINGDSLDRIFHILPGNEVEISLVTVQEGYAFPGNGGGILNEGNLVLNQLHISNNTTELN